jgi:hypothetical protein
MDKGKIVFLFGAGAGISWNAPPTSELTELVRYSGFKTLDNETYITDFIFKTLIENGFKEDEINFETIINIIEELIVYYSHFDWLTKTPSLLKGFFTPTFEATIFNYSVKGGEALHNYQLNIPKDVEFPRSNLAQHNETPHQFFLQHLLVELLTFINARISKYAYHTTGNSVIECKENETDLFVKWMQRLSERNTLRLYTLNYDRIFKILLEQTGISVFEGFDCGEFVGYGDYLRANVKRILTDFDNHVHYNLHGSAFWKMIALDHHQLPNPEFVLTSFANLPSNDDHIAVQMERGKSIIPSNIITGYQKAQKTLITPFKQMQAAFDRDCCFADEIYIIGYGLGDEHINESIKTAIRHNEKVKIVFVDPNFLKNDLDFQTAIRFFPYRSTGNFQPRTIVEGKLHTFFDGAFMLHTIDFKTFLEEQTDPFRRFKQYMPE